ncbi:MAG TPA: amino acid permease C-terminal domain-containing protein, partial [Steroidobacteraceae bacterium]|nr:amino acid permease C-terminal domain-containing protein [Steroidobacteraceae bacterium]
RPFRVKGVWTVATLGIIFCGAMILTLPIDTWIRLVVWTAIGVVIYFTYSAKRSKLRNNL